MLRRWLICLLLLTSACDQAPEEEAFRPVPRLQEQGELVVLVRNGANSFYVDAEGKYAGLEYDLVTQFAKQIGVKVKLVVAPKVADIPARLLRGEAHLGVGMPSGLAKGVNIGPSYYALQPALVYRSDANMPRSAADLDGVLMAGPIYVPALKALQAKHPGLRWHEAEYLDAEELVEKVANGLIDYAVADRHAISVALNYYPDASIAFNIGDPVPLTWGWSSSVPNEFGRQVNDFFKRAQKDGTLANLIERYYGRANRLQPIDASTFLARRLTELPKFRKHFINAEAQYGTDWRLLAALAYQESHWDPFATSAYGVRGLMMLTNDTADRMGVGNRLDPLESIMGGAKYIDVLKNQLPGKIAEPDRSWLALAAYNIGTAHLEDARVLAQRLGKNPNKWNDLKTVVPLLRNYEYFSTLKYGFARGGETVIFVENVRSYYDILVRFENAAKPMFSPFDERVTVANPDGLRLGINQADAASQAH
ncbi:membrane-bound lytic murein transglycosylase MltF [Chitinimonas sp.]|uniref:membrane-bound lytic murein transglycosylase MltF n=1 Tax=Chitinimonas sp. TaxID=1934313 RepID=UPI0035AEB670